MGKALVRPSRRVVEPRRWIVAEGIVGSESTQIVKALAARHRSLLYDA
jgi:hypothetical protein